MFLRPLSVYLIKKKVVPLILTCIWTSRREGRPICEFVFYPTLAFWTSRPATNFFPYWNLATSYWFTHFLNLAIQMFTSRLRMNVRVNLVLNRTVVDSDWHFDNLCSNHLQSQIFKSIRWDSTWRDEQQPSRTKKHLRHQINHDIKSKSKTWNIKLLSITVTPSSHVQSYGNPIWRP